MSFKAKYDGRCGECGEEIARGDDLTWVETSRGRTAVHAEECADRVEDNLDPRVPSRETCPDCWQTIAVNGSCGCDE